MNSRLNRSSEKEGPGAAGGTPLESTTGEFPSGAIRWSPRAIKLHDKIDFRFYLRRHLRGDDGDVSEGQHLKNFFAWHNGLRVSSVYNTPASPDGKVWIVTEADRRVTYILLPSDYPACMLPKPESTEVAMNQYLISQPGQPEGNWLIASAPDAESARKLLERPNIRLSGTWNPDKVTVELTGPSNRSNAKIILEQYVPPPRDECAATVAKAPQAKDVEDNNRQRLVARVLALARGIRRCLWH